MKKESGSISVQTENIFPIIKKFLYSDHEIFLRELISNAVDATHKLQTLSSRGEVKGDLGDLTIQILVDDKKNTLSVIDKGIGMTAEELKKYINEIAFSSAQEFLEKNKDASQIIGHFGLGFYSAFMVAKEVEIITYSWIKDAEPVRWTCNGTTDYTLQAAKKKERGTEIILHLDEDNKEFSGELKIKELLEKYCKFLPVPIQFGEEEVTSKDADDKEIKEKKPRIINNIRPAWTKKPVDLKDKDYTDFYRELYPMAEAPLFWIHLNVDYPFNLTGILYFPKISKTYEVQKNKIHLYSNQVFVTDEVKEIVPEWLTLLHGVIDSPDIPLNVSRSYLQSDQNVKKINSYITKKVAEKLGDLYKEDRKVFEDKWEHTGLFVKYGMLSDEKFYDRAQKFCLLQNTEGKLFSLDEYQERIKGNQTNKDDQLVYLYTTDKEDQHTYIEKATARGYDVLVFDTLIDPHFISFIEQKLEKSSFKRVDAEVPEKLIVNENEEPVSTLNEKEEKTLKTLIENNLQREGMVVELKAMSPEEQPLIIVQPEFMRRMADMNRSAGMGMDNMPGFYSLIVNSNHPALARLLKMKSKEKKQKTIRQLIDLAMLSQNMLKGEALSHFISRSVELI